MERREIVVTGASGFVGGRLARALAAEGERVRCLVRGAAAAVAPGCRVVRGDLLEPASLPGVLEGVDTAFYLVHSIAPGSAYRERDRRAAGNFRRAAEAAGVRRVIYLGGMGEASDGLSQHLQSRREVGQILAGGRYDTTILRAAVVIGAGSASFETMKRIVEGFPVLAAPPQIGTLCQPIAVADVVACLRGCLREERSRGGTFDIGGPDLLTYRDMLEILAEEMARPFLVVPTPLLTPRSAAAAAAAALGGNRVMTRALLEGVGVEVVCRERRLLRLLGLEPMPYREAVRRALAEGEAASGGPASRRGGAAPR